MITFVFESFNQEQNAYNYNNWPSDWMIDGVKTQPFNSHRKELGGLPNHFKNKIQSKLYSELEDGEKYFYPIIVNSLVYFKDMESRNFSFNFIDEKVLNDVRNNRAKIVIITVFETSSNYNFTMLHKWCKNFNFTKDQVYYCNGNFLGPKFCENLNFTCLVSNEMANWNMPFSYKKLNFQPDTDKYLFLTLNRRERPHRSLLLCHLIKNNLISRGFVSYKGKEQTLEQLQQHILYLHGTGFEEEAKQLYSMSPLTLDIEDLDSINPVQIQDQSFYQKTFLSIVTETNVEFDSLFFTEKTWKTLCIGHPFFVVGNKHHLRKLKDLGFKTFDKWFDESYDEMYSAKDRIAAVSAELVRLNDMGIQKLIEIRNEMEDTLKYNKSLLALYWGKILTTNNDFGLVAQLDRIWQGF